MGATGRVCYSIEFPLAKEEVKGYAAIRIKGPALGNMIKCKLVGLVRFPKRMWSSRARENFCLILFAERSVLWVQCCRAVCVLA